MTLLNWSDSFVVLSIYMVAVILGIPLKRNPYFITPVLFAILYTCYLMGVYSIDL